MFHTPAHKSTSAAPSQIQLADPVAPTAFPAYINDMTKLKALLAQAKEIAHRMVESRDFDELISDVEDAIDVAVCGLDNTYPITDAERAVWAHDDAEEWKRIEQRENG